MKFKPPSSLQVKKYTFYTARSEVKEAQFLLLLKHNEIKCTEYIANP